MNREREIVKASIYGIIGNALLVAFKMAVGFMSHSIAIILDGVNNATDALSSIVTIVGKTWDEQVTRALLTTLDENLRMIRESVAYLKAQGLRVVFDAEHFFDGYKANPDFALACVRAASEAGADSIDLCETNGGALPHEVGEIVAAVKGAIDSLLPRCAFVMDEGGPRPIEDQDRAQALAVAEGLSDEALRVLAVAYKEINALPDALTPDTLETDLTFLGLVGMIDPPRPEAKAAVATCRRAGIKPVMITGDHVVTASAIARELGILTDGDRAITGAELDAMTDDELDAAVEQIAVYARVSPENKIRIVKAWQRKGQVVSMTGDGVNDAPALKAADIGCAMGITGTDVAKGAADMTLTDDNFATIVDAVREGRGIYANIRKVVGFLLGTNIGEVITVFAAMLLWRKTPLLSMQLLLINLATDSLPAIALGMEAVEADVMDKKPKPKSEGLFAHGLGVRIVLQGFLFALLTLIGFVAGEKATGTLAGGQTLAFMVLALSQVVQAYNMRSDRSLFAIGPFSNHKLNWAALASTALVALVLFTPVGIAFGLVTLPWQYYLLGLGLILAPLLVMEIAKLCGLIRHHGRK